jgi:hypothetical protein
MRAARANPTRPSLNRPPTGSLSRFLPLALAAMLSLGAGKAGAQDIEPTFTPGDAVVTGFSGATTDDGVMPVGGNPADRMFIDLDGPSMQILRLALDGTPANGQLISTPPVFQVKAGHVGQVFGIALDDGTSNEQNIPNIYLTATSAFGVQIVRPDSNGDGLPERTTTGAADATFMDGQFGFDGSPGTIWVVNGLTGDVQPFAEIAENSGGALGNIAFDANGRQFFVSDLDTGKIHRINENGDVLDFFDHGVAGRAAAGLAEVGDDAATMDITSPAFDAQDPGTWGLTQPERRVWGLAMNEGRLYYAVWTGQIWSVDIAADGGFGADARLEIDIASDGVPMPVSDMVFDRAGVLYLAQRGGLKSSYDYTVFADARQSKVLRYVPETPDDPSASSDWVQAPQEYAIGLPQDHENASGGIDIGHGYDSAGLLTPNKCDILWSSGDALRNAPELGEQVSANGPLVVHGLQGNDIALVRPANVPPLSAYFADYDGKFADPEKEGHVGDVEIFRNCLTYADGQPPYPLHTKAQTHLKHASHSRRLSHYKYGSYTHTKRRSHYKQGSQVHTKRRSHYKQGSQVHTKRRSHYKQGSQVHTKQRSHYKKGSRVHIELKRQPRNRARTGG